MISITAGSGLRGKERSIWRNSSTEERERKRGTRKGRTRRVSFQPLVREGPRRGKGEDGLKLTVHTGNALQARLGPEKEVGTGRDVVERSRASRPGELSGEGRGGLDGGDGGDGRLDGSLGERSSGDGRRETGRLGSSGRRRLSSGSDDSPGSSSVGILVKK